MKLEKKKSLAAKTLGVGKDRIIFNSERMDEIKEAITRQDIRDLFSSGAIKVREVKGRLISVQRKTRRRFGSIRHKAKKGKRNYMHLTRKLRAYLAELRKHEKITSEQHQKLRKEIKASQFRSKAHIKEILAGGKK